MALAATGVFEVQTGGSDTLNGGYYNPARTGAGTDYSILSPLACTDLAIDGADATKVSSAAIGFTTDHQGNSLRIPGSTPYEILSVSGGVATLDRAAGTVGTTGGTARVGGALASPGQACATGFLVAGSLLYIKNGTYTLGTTANVAGGRISPVGGGAAPPFTGTRIIGYNTNRTPSTTDTGPTLAPGAAGVVCVYLVSYTIVRNLIFANSGSYGACTAVQADYNQSRVEACKATGFATSYNLSWTNNLVIGCESEGAGTYHYIGVQSGNRAIGCSAIGGNGVGFQGLSQIHRCAAVNLGGNGFNYSDGCVITDSMAYGITGTGFLHTSPNPVQGVVINSLAAHCSAYGFGSTNPGLGAVRLIQCAGYLNSSGNVSTNSDGAISNTGFIHLTAEPATNAAGLDFTPNLTAGGGLALRAVGWPATLPGLAGTNAADIGAFQHVEPTDAEIATAVWNYTSRTLTG